MSSPQTHRRGREGALIRGCHAVELGRVQEDRLVPVAHVLVLRDDSLQVVPLVAGREKEGVLGPDLQRAGVTEIIWILGRAEGGVWNGGRGCDLGVPGGCWIERVSVRVRSLRWKSTPRIS